MVNPEAREAGHHKEHDYAVVVNGRPKEVTTQILTYEEVVLLAFDPVPTDKDITVSFRDAEDPRQGTLQPGESLKVKHHGTSFIVTATDKA